MKANHGWAATALAAAVLSAAPGHAQERSCDDGRGGIMADLGFEHTRGRLEVNAEAGEGGMIFESEPRITAVRENGPAIGRVREGDVLVAVNGHRITTPEGARRYSEIHPGERVALSVRRDGSIQVVSIVAVGRCIPHPPTAPEAPAPPVAHAPAAPFPPAAPLPPADEEIMPEGWFGFAIRCQNCGEDESTGVFRFREPPVVVSVEPNSPAARAGLRPGDRLTHVDGVSLTSEAGWPWFYAIQPGEEVQFTYTRDGRAHQVTMTALYRAP